MEHPLSLEWMRTRKVTLEEVTALSARIAVVLRAYDALHPRDRVAFLAGIFTAAPPVQRPTETILGARHNDVANPEIKTTK